MSTRRLRSELVAWASGVALGALVGIALGAWSTPLVGIVVGAVFGLLVALSVRRGRGSRGWSDVDGDSVVGEGSSSEGIPRTFVKGSPSPADLPVTPGMGAIGSGPTGIGS
ncbi:hypothetical protein G3N18_05675 [Microbacterium sp. 2C]|uniref:hypothetical protein n=1 Tax=Microbacterium paulum TaxID=2707006 RepID=UPI0018C30E79|nr:hypothetical protein [Microbacterium paulum]MBG0717572.1 hypothetical protein [Microbacterium paulum]